MPFYCVQQGFQSTFLPQKNRNFCIKRSIKTCNRIVHSVIRFLKHKWSCHCQLKLMTEVSDDLSAAIRLKPTETPEDKKWREEKRKSLSPTRTQLQPRKTWLHITVFNLKPHYVGLNSSSTEPIYIVSCCGDDNVLWSVDHPWQWQYLIQMSVTEKTRALRYTVLNAHSYLELLHSKHTITTHQTISDRL